MNQNKYKVRVTNKALPFTGKDMVLCNNMSLIEAVKFSDALNKSFSGDKIALVEYQGVEGETDTQSKQKVIADVKTHGLEEFSVFKDNMLILTQQSMNELSKFLPATDFVEAKDRYNINEEQDKIISKAMGESKSIEKKVDIVTKANEFDNLSFVTYDVVHESMPFPIATGLYLASSAMTIADAIRNGDAINCQAVMEALAANNVYSQKVVAHVNELRTLLKENKQKTKIEIAEEAAIEALVDIETMLTRMKNTSIHIND